jgi:predicted Ser/Thr protein kinase
MTPRPDPRVGSDLGPYRIESVIGRGGMGVVYLATHAGLDRKVALKLLAPDFADDEAFRARFLRESRMAAAIDHPNIIPIYEAGEVDGVYFLAMRYVAGTDLETRLRAGPLEPREAVRLLGAVASALDAAHEQGLIHRDVKPANVLVATGKGVEKADHAYLTDFGLTKHRGSQSGLTEASAFIGTLDYIAPEQIEGKPVDGRTDQYGLACVAFECLAGRVPYVRDTDIAIAMAHLRDAPPSALELRPDLPADVDAVLARGMAKRPDDRYPSCEAFVVALRGALGVRPTEERRAVAAGGRPTRRLVVGAIAVLVVGVVLVALGSFGLGGGAGPSPSAVPASPGGSAASASAVPSASASGATGKAFPNADEQALLAKITAVPGGFAKTCVRGPYEVLTLSNQGRIRSAAPLASLKCSPDIATTGSSEVLVRQFHPGGISPFVENFVISLTVRWGADGQPINVIPPGDCAVSSRATGPWSRGKVACYSDIATGDAILWWSHDQDAILVKARNPRGDSAALYSFFDQYARFMAP